jgi:hypothetical protein
VIAVRNFGASDLIEVAEPPKQSGNADSVHRSVRAGSGSRRRDAIVIEPGGRIVRRAKSEIQMSLARLRAHAVSGDVSGAARAFAGGQGTFESTFGRWKHTTFARPPPTGIARSMTRRPAVGPGMVMRADILAKAIDAASPKDDPRPRLLMSPRGAPLTQQRVRELSSGAGGRDRLRALRGRGRAHHRGPPASKRFRLGITCFPVGRSARWCSSTPACGCLPGVMGHAASGLDESFSDGLLEYPQYTRPQEFEGVPIPEVSDLRRPCQSGGLAPFRGRRS